MRKRIAKRNNSNWAKTAVRHPGAFRSWCKRQGYKGVNTACIRKGKKATNSKVRKRAILADNFRKMRAKRKKKKR